MDEDDVDFSVPANARSRLSSLFQNEKSSGDINEALTFTAPKQPKKTENAQGASGTSKHELKLLHAVIVHAYKQKDGSYTNQGKLGCAVLGHHESHTYRLLLYKGKQIHVTIVSITANFVFHVQSNNYVNFYDQNKENWSINFDSDTALFDFTKQVALAKANSQTSASLVIQDLVKGEGHSLGNGDIAEIKYSGWLLQNCTFGQMFESNMNSESSLRVRLGKGQVIKGLNDGLLGMQKGGKRILVIPSELAYGAEGKDSTIPPNSTLIFEVHVVKIKVGRETSHSPSPVKVADSTTDKKPDVPHRQSISQDDNIKMRGASISEQLSQSPKKDKAQLISRMAKMGTATLPFQGAVAAHVSSDSESETELPQPSSPAPQNISRTSSPKAFSKPRSQTNSEPVVSSQTIVQPQPIQVSMPYHPNQPSSQVLYAQSVMQSQSPFVCAATPFSAYQQQIPGQFSVPQSPYPSPYMPPVSTNIADSHFSLLMAESRNQNSEVRISLSKITDKVDTVLQKVDELNFQRRATSTSMPLMESAILLQNIERIIQENKQLKEDNESKVFKIQSLNEIISDLCQRNQRLSDESANTLGQRNGMLQATADRSQEKISDLEREKSELELELSSLSNKLSKIESNAARYKLTEVELSEKLERTQRESKAHMDLANEMQEKVNENKTLIKSLQEKLQTVEHEKELLNLKLQSIEEEHSKAQGSYDLIDVYKKEIQEYKEKIEHLNAEITNSVPTAQFEEVKQNMGKELAEVTSSKEKLTLEIKEMKEKMELIEEQKLCYEDKIRRLECEIEDTQLLKRKFEVFQEKTRALKKTYENQILELMNEIKHLKSTATSTPPEFAVEIKRTMNRLYKLLQGKFESSSSYTGTEVLQTVLQNIMAIMYPILEGKNQSSGSGDQTNINESSEKGVSKEELNTDESQREYKYHQNNLNDLKVAAASNDPVADSVLPDVNSSDKDSNVVSEVKEEVRSIKSEVPGVKEESATVVNKDDGAMSAGGLGAEVNSPVLDKNENVEPKNDLKVAESESVKRESPDSDMPSSDLFSQPLLGTDGTKVWRQPPPLFDDDDDEDEDDDWLK